MCPGRGQHGGINGRVRCPPTFTSSLLSVIGCRWRRDVLARRSGHNNCHYLGVTGQEDRHKSAPPTASQGRAGSSADGSRPSYSRVRTCKSSVQVIQHQQICLSSTLKHAGPQADWDLVGSGLWTMSTNEMHVHNVFRVMRLGQHFWTSLMM